MADIRLEKRTIQERLIIAKTLIETALSDLPTAETEKRGKWIDERGVEYCSVCGKTPDIWCSFDVSEWKYCPLCGARMEE